MTRFKVMDINQSVMTRLGINSFDVSKPTNEFLRTSIVSYYILFILTMVVVSCVEFVYKKLVEFEEIFDASLLLIASIRAIGAYINIGMKMTKVKLLHQKLQTIVDQGIFIHFIATNYTIYSEIQLM